jgi:cbb3-type cytochrome oxidase maturation protein
MDALYLLLPLALGFVAVAVLLFGWAVRDGQFDDLETPARRALLDDTDAEPKKAER